MDIGMVTALVNLSDKVEFLETDVRFYTGENFIGSPLPGYDRPVVRVTVACAQALQVAQKLLLARGLSLRVYDGYRPREAEAAIQAWLEEPEDMPEKILYYPKLSKEQLVAEGFLSFPSAHRTGNALDLTVFRLDTGLSLDMGTPYGYLSPASKRNYHHLTPRQVQNRMILKYAMGSASFRMTGGPWWHFVLDGKKWSGQKLVNL